MECRNCPYIKEIFNRIMNKYEKTISEQGMPNVLYGYLEPQDAADQFERFLWCDKIGGKDWCGRCEDAYSDIVVYKNHSKKRKRNKRERDLKYKNHVKFLAENTSGYPTPAIYIDKIYVGYQCIDNPKPYYKRIYRGKRSKYLKRQSNKKIRRYKGGLQNGWNCHRLFDFWWEMY